MHHHYADIRDRISEPPKWWDEYGVPRYCEFGPDETSNIYAYETVLLLIECQGCGAEFKVCLSHYPIDSGLGLRDLIDRDEIHYGDPPNAGCCAAGPTMNSIPRRVLEFWDRNTGLRVPELEREIRCDWAEEADRG